MSDPRNRLGPALDQLESILDGDLDELARDAALHRFQLCFELCWNSARQRLQELDVDCASPNGCVQAAARRGWIDPEPWLEMIEVRNQLPQSSEPEIAEAICGRLGDFAKRMRALEAVLVD